MPETTTPSRRGRRKSARTSSAEQLRDYFTSLAPEWESWRERNRYYHDHVKDLVAGGIAPGSRVLDVGAGSGDVLAAVDPAEGIGVNVSEPLTLLAREKRPGLTFLTFDADAVELPDGFRPDYV